MKTFIITFLLFVELVIVLSTRSGIDLCPKIIKKNRWGGRVAKSVEYIVTPVKYVIIHHTATPTCTNEDDCSRRMVNMQSYHTNDLGYNDISYNFAIGGDGKVYEGAGWHKVGSHAGSEAWNKKSVGIALIGNFSSNLPSSKQLEAAKRLIDCAVEMKELEKRYKLLGARSVKNTESPGRALYEEIQGWYGFTRSA